MGHRVLSTQSLHCEEGRRLTEGLEENRGIQKGRVVGQKRQVDDKETLRQDLVN